MVPEISHVAIAFYVVAAVIGIPALAGILFSLVFGFRLWRSPSPGRLAPTKNPDIVILTIVGMARVIGAVAGVIGALGKVVALLLALLSLAGLALSGLLLFVANGLDAREQWALQTAGVVLAGVLLGAALAFIIVPRWWKLLALAGAFAASCAFVAILGGYPG